MKLVFPAKMILLALVAFHASQAWPSQPGMNDPLEALQKQGVKFFARFSIVDDAAWKVLVNQQEGEDQLTVMDDRTARVLLSASGNSERFLSADVVQVLTRSDPFLVTRWTKGAHGQEIRIYDPKKTGQSLVYSKASSWTIDYQYANGRIKIVGRGDERTSTKKDGAFEVAWP